MMFDIAIIAIIAIPAIIGIWCGFFAMLLSLVGWLAGLLVAWKFSAYPAGLMEGYLEPDFLRNIIAFIVTLFTCLLICSGINFLVLKFLKSADMNAINRLLGLLFGISIGQIMVLLLVFIAGFTDYPTTNEWQNAILIPPFQYMSQWGQQFLPANLLAYHGYPA